MSLKTGWNRFVEEVIGSRPSRPRPPGIRGTRLRVDELEPRVLLATDLGTLVGRQFLSGQLTQSSADTYNFKVQDAAFLDVQITDLSGLLQGPATIFAQIDSPTGPQFATDGHDAPSNEASALHLPVPAGTSSWDAKVNAAASILGTKYHLALAADQAPGGFSGSSVGSTFFYDIRADVGLDLGSLSAVDTTTIHDFIGYLDTSFKTAKDRLDVYFFTIPVFGSVNVTLDQLENDVAGGNVYAELTLLRDVNGDGLLTTALDPERPGSIQTSETLFDNVAHPQQSASTVKSLNAGRYAIVVNKIEDGIGVKEGGTNYRLRVSYSVADSAGDTPATARVIAGPGNLAEYLSSGDPTDLYKVTLSAGGPFVLNAGLTNVSSGANFDVDILQDVGGTLQVLARGNNPFGDETVLANTATAGAYYFRVRQVSGEGPYTLSASVRNTDLAGNTLGTANQANNFADLFGQVRKADFVSPNDSEDIFRFSLAKSGTITASFPLLPNGTDATLQLIHDENGNGDIDPFDILVTSATRGNTGESIMRILAAGTYYVRVLQVVGSLAYQLTLTSDIAGNSLPKALTMGLSGAAASTVEFIGPGDSADFFRVFVPGSLQLNLFFSLFSEPFTVSIGRDGNDNGGVDPGETIFTKRIATVDDLRQTLNLTTKGDTFFVQISSTGTIGTNYGIVFATAPTDNAGNTPAAAREVGVLGTTRTFIDFVGDGSIDVSAGGQPVLGADDVDDYYRFTLGTNGKYDFTGRLFNLTGNADMELIFDAIPNQKFDAGLDEVLATSSHAGIFDELITKTLEKPGTYFLHVFRPPGAGTTGAAKYTLSLTADSQDTAGSTLLASKPKGLLTSNTPISDSEFVGAIDLDDFYFFTVQESGILSVARSANQVGIGVEVIQDANFNFAIDPLESLANSGGAQTFDGPIKFTASLPAAGTFYIHVFSNGLDADYTLNLSFSNTVGFFGLNPRESTINTDDHIKLALDWTVPTGSWHSLQDVQLRLRDAAGTLALINFHEADNTVSLFDPKSGKFGPAKLIGSNAVLANRDVKIFLKNSSVKAAGPSSPTVTLTFDLQLNGRDFDRRILIEAAASDDLGQVQDFAFAGTLIVLRHRRRP